MTLEASKAQSELLKAIATQYKSDLQDLFAALSSHVMKVGKWDDEFNKLFSTLSMAVTAKTQEIEYKAVELYTTLDKVG